jgi:hypothetical protein
VSLFRNFYLRLRLMRLQSLVRHYQRVADDAAAHLDHAIRFYSDERINASALADKYTSDARAVASQLFSEV